MIEIKQDFSKARVGDRAWSSVYGEGVILAVDIKGDWPIAVKFIENSFVIRFNYNGFEHNTQYFSTLFHANIFEQLTHMPEPPKRKVKKTVWVNLYSENNWVITGKSLYNSKVSAEQNIVSLGVYIGTYPIEIEVEE